MTSLDSQGSAVSDVSAMSADSTSSDRSRVSSNSSTSSRLSMLVRTDRRMSLAGLDLPEGTRRWVDTIDKRVVKTLSTIEKKRQQVIYELIYTEEDYLRDLNVIKRLFRQSVIDGGCLSAHEISALFSNLDEVVAVNTALSERLRQTRDPRGLVPAVGHIFVELLEGQKFDAYLQFCTNQNPACILYQRLREANPEFDSCMAACVSNIGQSRGFDLPAYLLKGMQRLLKYQPLLQQVRKYTMESEQEQVAALKRATKLLKHIANKVNDKVRASENARRLVALSEKLSKEQVGNSWLGKPTISLDLMDDPARQLITEGTMHYVRQARFLDKEKKTEEVYAVLVSDKLLLCHRKEDGGLVLRDTKDWTPVIYLQTITDVRGEITPGTADERTTLSLEIGAAPRAYVPTLLPGKTPRDSPRPEIRLPEKRLMKFELTTQSGTKAWAVHLIKSIDMCRRRLSEMADNPPEKGVQGLDEYAVTLLISTKTELPEDSEVKQEDERTPDWEIEFTHEADTTYVETTRHVRLVQCPAGLGFTLIGSGPVHVQEVEADGVAYSAGMRTGDVVRAVNGHECTNLNHDDVVGLVRNALSKPQPRTWVPTHQPLEAIRESDVLSNVSLVRGPHRTQRMRYTVDPDEV
eukprot:UC1_evm1s1056